MISIEIPKASHRFIAGSKGSGLLKIWETTGCLVKIPKFDIKDDYIIIRGPQKKLSAALILCLELVDNY